MYSKHERPLAVDRSDLEYLRNIQSRFLDSRLIERLIQNIRLGIAFVKHLDRGSAVPIYGLSLSDRKDLVKLHKNPPHNTDNFDRCCFYYILSYKF